MCPSLCQTYKLATTLPQPRSCLGFQSSPIFLLMLSIVLSFTILKLIQEVIRALLVSHFPSLQGSQSARHIKGFKLFHSKENNVIPSLKFYCCEKLNISGPFFKLAQNKDIKLPTRPPVPSTVTSEYKNHQPTG